MKNSPEYTKLYSRYSNNITTGVTVTCRSFTKGEMGFNECDCHYPNGLVGKIVGVMSDDVGYFVVRLNNNGYFVPFFAITSITSACTETEMAIKSKEFLGFHNASELRIGDCVRITRKAEDHEMGWCSNWFPVMNKLVGNTYTIVGNGKELGWVISDNNNITWHVPDFILQKVDGVPIYFDTTLGYKVSINKTTSIVRVGEHKLTPKDLKSILNIMTGDQREVNNPDELDSEQHGTDCGGL